MYELKRVSEETFDGVLSLCKEYATERDLEWLVHTETWYNLLTKMCSDGTAYVLLRGSLPIGMLLIAKGPHPLNMTKEMSAPVVIYVKPDYRGANGWLLMLDKIEEVGLNVDYSYISLPSSANLKPETMAKFGYKVSEIVYVKE